MPKIYTDEEKELFRQQLLHVGLHMFCRKGYKATSVDDVISRVGVSKGLFYTMFPSKESFALETIEIQMETLYELIQAEISKENLSLERKLRHILITLTKNEKHVFWVLQTGDNSEFARNLTPQQLSTYMKDQEMFFHKIVLLLGKDPAVCSPRVISNLAVLLFQSIFSLKDNPFLFQDRRDITVQYFTLSLMYYILKH